MKLGKPPLAKTRREQRREQELEKTQGPRHATEVSPREVIKPAVLAPDLRPPALVLPVHDEVLDPNSPHLHPLPDQQVLKMTVIRPMQRAEIVLVRPDDESRLDVRTSTILDISETGVLYLAQTSPPILRSQAGAPVEVSFLGRFKDIPGGRWLRVGYRTQIEYVIRDYEIREGVTEPVFTVPWPDELRQTTVRASYRLVPPEDLDLRLVLWPDGRRLTLLDISAGGASFYHPPRWRFEPGSRLKLALLTGSHRFNLPGQVVRSTRVKDRLGLEQGVTSVEFGEMEPEERERFLRLLTETYRHLLAQRSGIEES